MSFYKNLNEIPEYYGKDAEFYDAEMLLVAFEVKPEIVERFLPPPLKPAQPIAIAFIADYPKTNFGAVYQESALVLQAEHAGVVGNYCLAMPVTDDMCMAGGREVYGYPKKMAHIAFEHEGDSISGWVERHGVRFFQAKARLGESLNPQQGSARHPLLVPADGAVTYFNFKFFPRPEGGGFDYAPRLITEDIVLQPDIMRDAEVDATFTPSKFDPWSDLEVVRTLDAIYMKGHNTMRRGRVVAEVDPVGFIPYAFTPWDI